MAASSLYLPAERFAEIENILIRRKLSGRIIPTEEIPDIRTSATDINDLFNESVEWVKYIISRYAVRAGMLRPLYFCLLQSKTVNAFATKLGSESYCVVISARLLEFLFNVSTVYLVCEPMVALFGLPKELAFLTLENCGSVPRRSSGWPEGANYSLARATARGMNLGVVSAVLHHELGHIANGHLDLLQEGCDDLTPVELRQVLEYDADCVAVCQTLLTFAEGDSVPRRALPFLSDQTNRFRFAYVSVYLMYRAMAMEHNLHADWKEIHAHMPHEHRTFFLTYALGAFIQRIWGLSFDYVENSVVDPTGVAVELSSTMLERDTRLAQAAETYRGEMAEYNNEQLRRWRIVQPLLQKLKPAAHELATAQSS